MGWARTSSDVILLGEARSRLYFNGLLCRVSLHVQPFVTFSFLDFLFFCFGCVFFSEYNLLFWVRLSTIRLCII